MSKKNEVPQSFKIILGIITIGIPLLLITTGGGQLDKNTRRKQDCSGLNLIKVANDFEGEFDLYEKLAWLSLVSYDFPNVDDFKKSYSKYCSTFDCIEPSFSQELSILEYKSLDSGVRYIVSEDGNRLILSFKGSEAKLADWSNNSKQHVGLTPPQYTDAVKVARDVKSKYLPTNMIITGHSLGGGLATYSALSVDANAVVFNSSVLNVNNVVKGMVNRSYGDSYHFSSTITNIVTDEDFVSKSSMLNSPTGLQGARFVLPERDLNSQGYFITSHSIKDVIDRLGSIMYSNDRNKKICHSYYGTIDVM